MSGAYSRLEKDFLGIERMVHYNAEGVKIGTQDIVREDDGTLRVVGEIVPVNEAAATYTPPVNPVPAPQVDILQIEEPTPSAPAPKVSVASAEPAGAPVNRTLLYVFGAFIGSAIFTFIVISFLKTSNSSVGSSASPVITGPQSGYSEQFRAPASSGDSSETATPETQPQQNDQGVPDMDTNGDGHPRIEDSEGNGGGRDGRRGNGDGRTNDSDPIDLRGGDDPGNLASPPESSGDDLR